MGIQLKDKEGNDIYLDLSIDTYYRSREEDEKIRDSCFMRCKKTHGNERGRLLRALRKGRPFQKPYNKDTYVLRLYKTEDKED